MTKHPVEVKADYSFVLLAVTCSPRGLVVHMQFFLNLKRLKIAEEYI